MMHIVTLGNGTGQATLLRGLRAYTCDVRAIYIHHGAYPVANDLTQADVPLYLADLVERPDAAMLRSYARPQGAGMEVGLHLIRHEARRLASQIMALASHLLSPSGRRQA